MDIIQVVKGDTGPNLRATVTRSDTGGAFVGTSNCILKIRKKGTTVVISTISLNAAASNLATGTLVFPLSSFLTDNTVEGFMRRSTFTLTDNTTMSVFELIDFKVREDF